jgi:hypothetical protein
MFYSLRSTQGLYRNNVILSVRNISYKRIEVKNALISGCPTEMIKENYGHSLTKQVHQLKIIEYI